MIHSLLLSFSFLHLSVLLTFDVVQEKLRRWSTVHFTAASTGCVCNLIKFYSAARGARLFKLSSKQDKSSTFAITYNQLTTILFTAVICSLHGQRKWWKWERTTWLVSGILTASLQCLHKEEEKLYQQKRGEDGFNFAKAFNLPLFLLRMLLTHTCAKPPQEMPGTREAREIWCCKKAKLFPTTCRSIPPNI